MTAFNLFVATVGLAAAGGKAFHDENHWLAGLLFAVCYAGRMWAGIELIDLSHVCLVGMVLITWRYFFWFASRQPLQQVAKQYGVQQGGHKPERRVGSDLNLQAFNYFVHP